MVIRTQPSTLKILFATFAQSFCGLRVKGINSIEAAMDAKFTQGDRSIVQREQLRIWPYSCTRVPLEGYITSTPDLDQTAILVQRSNFKP